MANTQTVRDRLRMEHLEPSIADLKAEVEEIVSPEIEDENKPDPRDNEEWTFTFSYKDGKGKVYDGEFTNKILNFGELQRVSTLKSRMCGGQPLQSFDSDMLILTGAIAHMSYSLKKSPSWAEDLTKLRDAKLVFALWAKVDSHESRYFRLEANSSGDQVEK